MIRSLKHIAIILDGNRRWAKALGFPAGAGHNEAVKRLEPLIKHAYEKGIKYITFYTFSTENWNRDPKEVALLMRLFRKFFKSQTMKRLKSDGVKITVLGELERFPKDIAECLKKIVNETEENKKITVNFALNYGGRAEMLRAVKQVIKDGIIEITPEIFSQYLYTKGQPDPDLIIRPGGEKRLSGFLLWQSEYSELYFTDTYMPAFDAREMDLAIAEYYARQRRFGK